MIKRFIVPVTVLGVFTFPVYQAFALVTTFEGLIGRASSIINTLIPFLISIMVFLLIVGIVQYTTSSDEEKHDKARKLMISAFIGLVIIICIWGIIRILVNTVGVDNSTLDYSYFPTVPCDPTTGEC